MNTFGHLSGDTVARFWSYVDKNGPTPAHCPELGPCWLWTGSRSVVRGKKTYGTLNVLLASGYRPVGAHRISFIIANGSITRTMLVLHHCDNKQCVNPTHLYEGTVAQNSADTCDRKLWTPPDLSGEKHPLAKLNWEKVDIIRRLQGFESKEDLALRFGVTTGAIESVWYRQSWKIKPAGEQDDNR